MRPSQTTLDRFIGSLHRRLLIVRALETTGRGGAAGCVAGAVVIAVSYWRDAPALVPALTAIALGAATGIIWSLTRRPTVLEAAAEADDQLGLEDLLGTALRVRNGDRESDRDPVQRPWIETVLATADAACARHTPSKVILHRLHARAWAAIGLAAAGVLTAAMLAEQTPRATAAVPAARATASPNGLLALNPPSHVEQPPAASRATPAARSQGTGPERDAATTTTNSHLTDESKEPTGAASPQNSTATGDTGTGAGAGRARTPPTATTPPAPTAATAAPASETGDPSAGGASASNARPPGRDTATGTTGAASAPARPPPPWQSKSWPDDVRRARHAVETDQIPAARRDLVRQYFDRP